MALAASLAWSSALAHAGDFEDLGLADLRTTAEHCWIPLARSRVGIATGVVDAIIAEGNRKEFESAGVVPSIGKRMYARVEASPPEPALIAAVDGEKITVLMPLRVAGYLFLTPSMPIALYETAARQPAITPRIWTDPINRAKLMRMMDCFDRLQGD